MPEVPRPTMANPTARLDCGGDELVDVSEVVSRLAVVLGQVQEALAGYDIRQLAGEDAGWLQYARDFARVASGNVDDLLDMIDATWPLPDDETETGGF